MTPTPTIFLSYCWKDLDHADAIDNDFKSIGISFRRDQRDLGYRQNIKDFMNTIGNHDFVVMLISDSYLRSINCMYEVTELLNSHQFNKKILPICLPDATDMFSKPLRVQYYEYWDQQLSEASDRNNRFPNLDHVNQIKECRNIIEHLDVFFRTVTDLNILSIEKLKQENYEPMLNLMGLAKNRSIDALITISKIEDKEEQELALERFLKKYPKDKYGLYHRAYLAVQSKQFKKAEQYFHDTLSYYPKFGAAHHNLALLYEKHFSNRSKARNHYLQAARLESNSSSYFNLSLISEDNEALKFLLLAIKIRPDYVEALCNIGAIYNNQNQPQLAKSYFDKAFALNPNSYEVNYNIAICETELGNYKNAEKHYLDTLKINRKSSAAHANIAHLYHAHLNELDKAERHYLKCLKLDKKNSDCHYNLAYLYVQKKEYKKAEQHYLDSLAINRNNESAYINLGNLYHLYLNNTEQAKQCFKNALEINPDNANANYNFGIILMPSNPKQAEKYLNKAEKLTA